MKGRAEEGRWVGFCMHAHANVQCLIENGIVGEILLMDVNCEHVVYVMARRRIRKIGSAPVHSFMFRCSMLLLHDRCCVRRGIFRMSDVGSRVPSRQMRLH